MHVRRSLPASVYLISETPSSDTYTLNDTQYGYTIRDIGLQSINRNPVFLELVFMDSLLTVVEFLLQEYRIVGSTKHTHAGAHCILNETQYGYQFILD